MRCQSDSHSVSLMRLRDEMLFIRLYYYYFISTHLVWYQQTLINVIVVIIVTIIVTAQRCVWYSCALWCTALPHRTIMQAAAAMHA